MMLFIVIVFGILGGIVGSFLNVLVLRKGVDSILGRSHCPACGKMIPGYDMVPVFSWFVLRGRCRNCGSKISFQYPAVEALTAILFALVGIATFPEYLLSPLAAFTLVLQLVVVSLLVAISIYDILHTIIPDEWVYTFGALALVLSWMHAPTFFTVLAGPLVALPLFLLWLVSRGAWMGLGDPKLALGIGWLLGIPLGIIAIFSSFILGSLVLVPLLVYERVTHKAIAGEGPQGLTMKSEVPFGPFLIATCFLFWLAQLGGVSIPLYLLGM